VSRGFCKHCGSPLSYQGEKWGGETHIVIGAFENPDGLIPDGEVFADEALPWVQTETETS
jgi:hypothetical protein